MKKKNSVVFKRHMFWWRFYTPVVKIIAALRGHKYVGEKLPMKNGEQYIILSNHQTDMDGILLGLLTPRNYYGLTSDSFFSKGWQAKMFIHQFGIIAKKKGVVDIASNMKMMRCVKEGGSLLIYPEGNRTYAEFQFPFTEGFGKFVRHFNLPVAIFNVHGGTGCYPRFGGEKRKGPHYTCLKRIIKPEEYSNWSDEKFEQVMKDELRVFDSESGCLYKSDKKAEYLERMFFVCPKCGAVQTLSSKGDHFKCSNCGLDVEYTEDLHLKSEDPEFKYNKLVDWYNYQIRFVRDYKLTDEVIFKDQNVTLFISNVGKKRKAIFKGELSMYKDKLVFGDLVINVEDIEIASPISGTKFNFTTSDQNYLVVGDERFNPLKYVLMLNKVESKMKINKTDIYYNLEERK